MRSTRDFNLSNRLGLFLQDLSLNTVEHSEPSYLWKKMPIEILLSYSVSVFIKDSFKGFTSLWILKSTYKAFLLFITGENHGRGSCSIDEYPRFYIFYIWQKS
ncbi:hypothetical protein MKW98_005448 [Papaver atlanticum]|uniref:Uncharacterized protein n=1 Tax=Papaver atlanticum TaxID=357466 RepID=A0AAD4T5Y5_9MAGN|nr:hypothetical protein MKW98_005448 [Papaver atlanticum]